MQDFLLLMHEDCQTPIPENRWPPYLAHLRATGALAGGSAIGGGETLRKSAPPAPITRHLGGYIRIQANSLADAKTLIPGNPVYEAGGTVEIRELPRE